MIKPPTTIMIDATKGNLLKNFNNWWRNKVVPMKDTDAVAVDCLSVP